MKKKILFVCSANKDRSKTAEEIFRIQYPNFEFKSAGTNPKECKKNHSHFLTEIDLIWADILCVMEQHHKNLIEKHVQKKYEEKIKIFKIKDIYKYNSPKLVQILNDKFSIIVEEILNT